MKRYEYHFQPLRKYLENVTGLKIAFTGQVIGVNMASGLRSQFGTRAQRHYPYGAVMVLPDALPVPHINELIEGSGWEPEISV
jgi:hypothetical protein